MAMEDPIQNNPSSFNIVESSISDHKRALDSGLITSVDLVTSYLLRIAKHDIQSGLNAFTVFNPDVLREAYESDQRRKRANDNEPPRPLEGIPYTLKDSYKYEGMSVTNGSPALAGLMSNEDSHIAARLRAAGAVLIGKTNMPPMAAGGMQRGLYGRAESPYNSKFLTAAFSSGSSNGAATSLAASMAVFAMGSETVSSGRSPASNNALCAYTPSRGVLSCRGLWPLYVTCDVPVPYTRSIQDMLQLLSVIAAPDPETHGDFWRHQTHISISKAPPQDYLSLLQQTSSLKGKRIGVPKMYIGQQDSAPHAKPTTVHPDIISLWQKAAADLESLGAEIVYTDFPLVTNYENDSLSGETNNVLGAPADWNHVERSSLIAKAWNDFLVQNSDPKLPDLSAVDPAMLFPKPEEYIPDRWLEKRNWINYPGLPDLAKELKDTALYDIPGLSRALAALEAQRKRDLEDWMDGLNLSCIAFPANGDVGRADLEFEVSSAEGALSNGVRYSNGNRAIRHLGVPTAGSDGDLLGWAGAFEGVRKRRVAPEGLEGVESDVIMGEAGVRRERQGLEGRVSIEKFVEGGEKIRVIVKGGDGDDGERMGYVYLDGEKRWEGKIGEGDVDVEIDLAGLEWEECLGWDLKPLKRKQVMVLVVLRGGEVGTGAWVEWVWRE
ncbi:amidase signature domain-containing protein [Dendryphion nanum]|uniref:Amidase signature domain-containing protein n=1 Tax=Dendryphion nanum TaxID=256645 RepID=A0A9P9CZF9_9PLEO|nr:amidase signature domain-containing protein [Dendryphion nanum]